MELKKFIKHEFIGLPVEVTESSNKSQLGIKGIVVNETKNLLTIKTSNDLKKIQKKDASFIFNVDGKKIKINGSKIAVRPEDRIKIKVKKW